MLEFDSIIIVKHFTKETEPKEKMYTDNNVMGGLKATELVKFILLILM